MNVTARKSTIGLSVNRGKAVEKQVKEKVIIPRKPIADPDWSDPPKKRRGRPRRSTVVAKEKKALVKTSLSDVECDNSSAESFSNLNYNDHNDDDDDYQPESSQPGSSKSTSNVTQIPASNSFTMSSLTPAPAYNLIIINSNSVIAPTVPLAISSHVTTIIPDPPTNIVQNTVLPVHKIKQEPVETPSLAETEELITGDVTPILDTSMLGNASSNLNKKLITETISKSSTGSKLLQVGSENKVLLPVPARSESIKNWNEWSFKYTLLKNPKALEAFLKSNKIQHFFKCMSFLCSYSSYDRLDFSLHIMMDHKDEALVCCYCFRSHTNMDLFLDHMCQMHNELCFQCSLCMYRGCSDEHVRAHCKGMHPDKNITTITCPRVNYFSPTLDVPVELHKTYNCTWKDCSFRTLVKMDFQRHWQDQHPESKMFDCCYCNYETDKLDILVEHYSSHNMHAFECDYCSFGSKEIETVVDHICINHAHLKLQMLNRLSAYIQKSTSRNTNSPLVRDVVSSSTDCVRPLVPGVEGDTNNQVNVGIIPTSTSLPTSVVNKQNITSGTSEKGLVQVKQEPVSDSEDATEQVDSFSRFPAEISGCLNKLPTSSANNSTGVSDPKSVTSDDKTVSNVQNESSKSSVTYICLHCDKKPTSFLSAEMHARLEHQMKDLYQCSACNYSSPDMFSLKLHLKVVHRDTTAHKINLAFTRMPLTTNLEISKESNTGRGNVSAESTADNGACAVQGSLATVKKSEAAKQLPKPQLTSKTAPLTTYTCVFCNYNSSDKSHMITHLYMEIHYFKYICNYCNFRGRFPMDIVNHCKRTHFEKSEDFGINQNLDLEKWVEDYITAQKHKSDGQNILEPCLLDAHFEKNYCNMCQMKFESCKILQEHIYSHLHYCPHHCTVCDKSFTTLHAVERHHLEEHKCEPKGSNYRAIPIVEEWVNNVISQNKVFAGRMASSVQGNTKGSGIKRINVGESGEDVINKICKLDNTESVSESKKQIMEPSSLETEKQEEPALVRKTARKSVKNVIASSTLPSTSSSISPKLVSNLKKTARKSTTKGCSLVKTTARKSFPKAFSSKNSARKSFGARVEPPTVSELYPCRYGSHPENIDLSTIFIVTKPHGSQSYVSLSVFYLKDLFKRKPIVKVIDCKKSVFDFV